MNRIKTQSLKFNSTWLWLGAILLVGAALRFYHLGQNSFWLDEAGVAFAAGASSLTKMLEVVRSHVLAMPLDYLVVWLVGRISTQEAALRIPAALWGVGSLFLAYRLYRRLVEPRPALFGLLVLALSPLHIQYSQELRFYASFVFFYLLSTLMLWDALQQPTRRRWIIFVVTCVVGIYFHPYVLFAIANGIAWLALKPQRGAQARVLRINLLFSATLCLLAFLGGYLTFSASNPFKIPLMVFEQSPAAALATGLGWLPFYPGTPGLSWIWGILCAALELIGMYAVLRTDRYSPTAGLLYSILLQLAGVIGADILQHYFFAPRQLLMLLPLLCLFAGIGLERFLAWMVPEAMKTARPNLQRLAVGISILVIALASLPAIHAYQQDDKGGSRAITETILRSWQPGDSVLVTPAYNGFVYKYYIESVYRRLDVADRLWSADWDSLFNLDTWQGNIYLITPLDLTAQETQQLTAAGFEPRLRTYPQSRYASALWVRVNRLAKSQP